MVSNHIARGFNFFSPLFAPEGRIGENNTPRTLALCVLCVVHDVNWIDF